VGKLENHTACPDCGASVPIPDEIMDAAQHWQKLKKYQAKVKRDTRKTNKGYCQVKKVNK